MAHPYNAYVAGIVGSDWVDNSTDKWTIGRLTHGMFLANGMVPRGTPSFVGMYKRNVAL